MLPEVPNPAPAEISPVAFSSTVILIILSFKSSPSIISVLIVLKKFKFLKLFSVFFCNISLKGSPSSISNWFLITFSRVTKLPKIFIFFTIIFSVSLIIKFRLILFETISSSTDAVIVLNSSFKVISSISSKISSTEFIE